MTDVKNENVYKKPLHLFSKTPMTGFKRNGFCDAPPDDKGNHSIAGIVTDQFLDFSASKGNDLRQQAKITGGDKWCLCANRWMEAMQAAKDENDPVCPKVMLHATHVRALDQIDMKDLKRFAAEPEASNASNAPQDISTRTGATMKEA